MAFAISDIRYVFKETANKCVLPVIVSNKRSFKLELLT